MNIFTSRTGQICVLVSLYICLAPFLGENIHASLYTASVFIKDLLLWMLPVTVSLFIAHAISSFERKAPLFLVTLILFEALSNTCSVWYGYGCAQLVKTTPIHLPKNVELLSPLWRLPILPPSWWSADKGVLMGIFLGFSSPLKGILFRAKTVVEMLLTQFFARLIPIFVLGFVARMYKMGILSNFTIESLHLFLYLLGALIVYVLFLFVLGGGRNSPPLFRRIANLLPATGLSFSSGCSLSTMPWTISGAAKNLVNPELAKGVIPATTNIQQIGDCIVNCFLCSILYYQFNGHPPALGTWALFSTMFILARFATAAVLGGAIFLMLPLYETYLGFTPEMIALILALNVILDPIVTSSNVIANGALCKVFEKFWFLVQSKITVKA